MEKESKYIIYTDASFDDRTKLGTYAIIVMNENKVLKKFSKRCKLEVNNSTECEIFAVYQAMNIILSCYINKHKIQRFTIKTDCVTTRDFFVKKNVSKNIFQNNTQMLNTMQQKYHVLNKKLSKKGCSFTLQWIPRESNKIAHNYSYAAFRKIKVVNYKSEILVMDRTSFLEMITSFDKNQYEIMMYLFSNSNQQSIITMTQGQIAQSLNMSISLINKSIKKFVKLNIIEKVKNGEYAILI